MFFHYADTDCITAQFIKETDLLKGICNIPFQGIMCDDDNWNRMFLFVLILLDHAGNADVVLCKDNEYALYTTQYNEIIPFGEFDYITSVFQGKAWVRDKESGLWGVISLNL